MVRRGLLFVVGLLSVALSACDDADPTLCADEDVPALTLVVRSTGGVDLTPTADVVVVHLSASPVDSARGTATEALDFAIGKTGEFLVRVRHDGYQPQERTVIVPEAEHCQQPVTQHLEMTLSPVTQPMAGTFAGAARR